MKKLLFLFVIILINLSSFGQVKVTDMPTYTGDADSAWVPVVINNTNRKVFGIQLGGRTDSFIYATRYWSATQYALLGHNHDDRYPQLSGSYANPSWITSLTWTKINSTPTTVSGYGITDAVSSTTDNNLTVSGTTIETKKAIQTLTDGATITWNTANGYNAVVTLAGNRTLSITNAQAGQYGTLRVVQDATGGRTLTLPSGSKVINGGAGAITLTTTGGASDILCFYYNGTNYFWTIGKNYN
jgi:hypothetical protein